MQQLTFPETMTRGRERAQVLIPLAIVGIIIFSPLPQASVLEWAVLIIQLAALGLTAVYVLQEPKPQVNAFLAKSLRGPRYFFLAFFGVVFLQVIPLPKFLVKLIAPATYSYLANYSPDFGRSAFASISLVPNQTLREGLELLAYFLLGFLVIRTVTRFAQMRRILVAIIGMGVFQALYGLFELSSANPRILFYRKQIHLDSVTGTFVNRNHLAGYLEMVIPLAVGLVISQLGLFALAEGKLRQSWRQVVSRMTGRAMSLNIILTLAIVVMAIGLLKSRSRSGVFLLFFTFLLFLEIIVFHFSGAKERQQVSRRFINIAFLLILGLSLFVGLGSVLNRFLEDDTLFAGGRTVFWGNMAPMIRNFPLFGTGLGTFATVYPLYERGVFEMSLLHAHNDYLESMVEVGFLGTLALWGGILFMVVNIFLAWRERRNIEIKGLGMGGLVSLIIILFHSVTDFNLHIPANMLLFSVVLSLTSVIVFHRKSGA